MLGTDYPFPLGELQPGSLIESMDEFDEKLKVTLFHYFHLEDADQYSCHEWSLYPNWR